MIGKTFSHYKILERLGQGGMGVVYKAEDTKLKRIVALKFLPSSLMVSEAEKTRFVHEAQAAAALNHPNICTIYEIDEVDGQTFIAMEFIEGQSLMEKIEAGPLKLDEALNIAMQVAEGLQAAHEKQITHRDIKPANVMITKDGLVKIVDFGLAKLAGQTRLTKAGTTMGTVAYMSPEQARGEEVDHRADIWALGVVLYEMVTGEPPFEGFYEQAVIYSILNEAPEPVTNIQSEISSELEQIIMKALEKQVQQRYGSMKDLLGDLANLRQGAGVAPAQMLTTERKAVENSVAVIDFANITGDSTVDWLSGGIAETVTVDLKKIAALKVVSREKVSKALAPFAGQKITEKHAFDLGKILGVRWLVWGGFQKLGHALRITAHFTEVSTGELVGSAKIDGTMEDIFKLQDQIITTLTDALNVALTPSEIKKIETPETLDLEAYECYAKGRQLFNQFGKSSFEQAQALFEQALAIDPKYALAYSGLGSIHIFRFIGQTDVRDLDIGTSYLQQAIAYDPDLTEPYFWLTYAYTRKQRLDDAMQTGVKAVALDSDNFMAHYFLAVAYWFKALKEYELNRNVDAVTHLKKSIALQPQYEPAHLVIAQIYMLNGQYPEAKMHLEQAVAIEESEKFEGVKFVGALSILGNWYARHQQLDKALEWYQRSLKSLEESDHFYRDTFRALTYCCWGTAHYHRGQFDEALKLYKTGREAITKNPKALGVGYFLVEIQIQQAKTFYKLAMQREARQSLETAHELFESRKGYDFSHVWEGSDAQIYYEFASHYALRNQQQEAIEYLRKAVDCGWAELPFLESDESFTNLREDADYQKIVQELKARMPLP